MKNVFIAIAFVCTSAVYGQVSKIGQLFDQYQNSEGVTSIKIAKPMFQLLGQLNIEDGDMAKIKPLINKINSLKILIIEKDSSNQPRFDKLQGELKSALKNLNYEELISINSEDSNIRFLAENTSSNMLNNLLLSINSEDETLFMILEGAISMDDISNLISNEEK
jgi:hypothetical protein